MSLRAEIGVMVVALALALTAVGIVAQTSSAKDVQGTREPAHSRSFSHAHYSCIIQRVGWENCGSQVWVNRGQTIKVFLGKSGGKRVDFRVKLRGKVVGRKVSRYPGQPAVGMWTNRTGARQYLQVQAASPATVKVQAVGNYQNAYR